MSPTKQEHQRTEEPHDGQEAAFGSGCGLTEVGHREGESPHKGPKITRVACSVVEALTYLHQLSHTKRTLYLYIPNLNWQLSITLKPLCSKKAVNN